MTDKKEYTVKISEIGKPSPRPRGGLSDIGNMAIRAAAYYKQEAYIIPTYYGPRIEWNKSRIPYGTPYSVVNATADEKNYQVTIETIA